MPAATSDEQARSNVGQLIKAYVERVERVEEEIKTLNDDKKDIYGEAKGNGLDVKALKTIVQLRRKDPDVRQEEETILETYMAAMGML